MTISFTTLRLVILTGNLMCASVVVAQSAGHPLVRKSIQGAYLDIVEVKGGHRLEWNRVRTTKTYSEDDPFVLRESQLAASAEVPTERSQYFMICTTFQPPCVVTTTESNGLNYEVEYLAAKRTLSYETKIQHPDGSVTTVDHSGGTHVVSRSNGGSSTVGDRGSRHVDVVKTWFRPWQGDQILYVDKISNAGVRTRIYARPPAPVPLAEGSTGQNSRGGGLSNERSDKPRDTARPDRSTSYGYRDGMPDVSYKKD